MSYQLSMFDHPALQYLRSLPNFIEAPEELRSRCRVGGLDGRVGLYVGNLSTDENSLGYTCVLVMGNGDAFEFHPYSLFPHKD